MLMKKRLVRKDKTLTTAQGDRRSKEGIRPLPSADQLAEEVDLKTVYAASAGNPGADNYQWGEKNRN